MKPQIFSDIHYKIGWYETPEMGAEVTILAGDIDAEGAGGAGVGETFACPIVHVPPPLGMPKSVKDVSGMKRKLCVSMYRRQAHGRTPIGSWSGESMRVPCGGEKRIRPLTAISDSWAGKHRSRAVLQNC